MYFAEYSATQDCFHVAPVEECIETNLRGFRKGVFLDYVPLGIFDTDDAALQFCASLKSLRSGNSENKRA